MRCSLLSPLRYEGTWANGLQDGYGSETYADGGTYQGQWQRGMRHGYGVRQSAPFGTGLSIQMSRVSAGERGSMQSLSSDAERSRSVQPLRPTSMLSTTEGARRGFVLKARTQLGGSENNLQSGGSASGLGSGGLGVRRDSVIDKSGQPRRSGGLLRGLRIKKQKSTGDIDMRTLGSGAPRSVSSSTDSIGGRLKGKATSAALLAKQNSMDTGSNASFVSQDADITDPSTTETYMGEWKEDKRCGFGICERSDGLRLVLFF